MSVGQNYVGRVSKISRENVEVNSKLCLAINNIDYILDFIRYVVLPLFSRGTFIFFYRPFAEKLEIESTITMLEANCGKEVAEACQKTIDTLVLNTCENMENKIIDVLEIIGDKVG